MADDGMTFHPLPQTVADAFARQARACRDLGSPLVASICTLVAERGLPDSETRRRIATWPGTIDARGDAVPLRFAGALHRLVLDQADTGLASVFPPNAPDNDMLLSALRDTVAAHDGFIAGYLDSPPQTNEVARSAILLPALLALHAEHGFPLRVLEIGASAGLNQNLDRFGYEYGRWQWGDPASPLQIPCEWRSDAMFPEPADLIIAERRGCDTAPVPIATQADRNRLTSYVWPDQPHRLDRLRAALTIAVDHPPQVDKTGAADWLESRLAPLPEGHHTVLFHTIMWQYLPDTERSRAEGVVRRASRTASDRAPLSWLRFEIDGGTPGGGIHVTQWRGAPDDGVTRCIGRGDYHGRWLDMTA